MTDEHSDRKQPNYPDYPPRKSGTRIKDWQVDLQKKRFKSLTGHEPTDAELEMALDLNLM